MLFRSLHALTEDDAHAESGETLWEVPIPQGPTNDLVAAHLTLGDTPDLLFQTPDPMQPTLIRTRALSGKDGSSLWSFSEKPGNCGLQPAGISVADWNGDGYDDVLQQASFTRANSGVDGSSLIVGTVGGCYFLPAIVDPDHDGKDNVILQGGFESINMLTHDLSQQVFASTDGDRPYPYGALATCPSGQVWVEGSWQFPARLKITQLAGPQLGVATTLFLAGGARYPDQAAVLAAHAGQGQLTAVSVHGNLAGDGAPVAVVCATRVDGMHKRTHRRRPLSPLPKKSETDRIIRNGIEYNPIPEREKQQLAQARALRWLAHLAKLGVKPRASLPDGEGPSTQTTTPAHLRLGL